MQELSEILGEKLKKADELYARLPADITFPNPDRWLDWCHDYGPRWTTSLRKLWQKTPSKDGLNEMIIEYADHMNEICTPDVCNKMEEFKKRNKSMGFLFAFYELDQHLTFG
jgi:hypothetical protein